MEIEKRQEMAETEKIAETAETEKDEIAETAETERQDRRHGNERVHRDCKTTRQKHCLQRGLRQTRFTDSQETEHVQRLYEFTESQETITCTETVRVHREPRDCNMYRDCTSSPRAKRL